MLKTTTNQNLLATVFITGAAVLIIEITAVRILSPVYGSSLYVLSSILTIILTALSLGYWYGGKKADQETSVNNLLNHLFYMIAVSGLFIIGLLIPKELILPYIDSSTYPKIGTLIISFGLFFTPTLLLGIVSPYVIKIQSLSNPIEKIGTVVGATFFWGTAGSIFGSLITGFFLIPHLGIIQTIILVGIILVILGLSMPLREGKPLKKKLVTSILLITVSLIFILNFIKNNQDNSYIYSGEGIYSSIKIKDVVFNNRPARLLLLDTNYSSAIFLTSKSLVFNYTKTVLLYKKLLPETTNVLVLGGGAYTIPRTLTELDPNLNIDVVEIEPSLFKLAQTYFDLTDVSKITDYPLDARVFFKNNSTKKYDVIFSDAFGTDLATPFHLTTKEFYKLTAENLSPDGIFFLNIIAKPETDQPSLTGSTLKTLKAIFPVVKTFSFTNDKTLQQNIVFIARNSTLPIELTPWDLTIIDRNLTELIIDTDYLNSELVLTDDKAPIEYLVTKER